MNLCTIGANQECFEAEVETRAFTRRGSVDRPLRDIEAEVSGQVAGGIALDGYRFDLAFDGPGQRDFVVTLADAKAIARKLPSRLRQREGFGFGNLAIGWRASVLFAKELLVTFLDAENDVLNRLRAELLPVGILRQLLQVGDMAFERVETQRATVLLVVRLAQADAVVMDFATNIDLPMQPPVPFMPINLVDIGCTHEQEYGTIWSMSQGHRHTNTSVSLLNYHFVWIPRRRRKVLQGDVASRLARLIETYAERIDCRVISLAIEIDHVHLFLNAPATLAPDQIMHRIKGPTARILRAEFPHLRRMPSMWTRSYYVSTAGNVSSATIRRYIEAQGTR